MHRAFLVSAAALCAAAVAAPALPAAVDLLELPARATPRAAQSVQVGIAAQGARLVAVGERGIVLRSEDAGAHWQQAAVPVSVTLTAVQWASETVLWAVGHDGVVLRSEDAGRSWQRRLDGHAANRMAAQAAAGALDAAKAVRATAPDTAARIRADQAVERAAFIAADAEAAEAAGPSRPLLALHFETPAMGWVAGSYGQLFRTVDGGAHWEFVGGRMGNDENLHLHAIHARGDTLLIAAEAGRIFRSDDRGAHWRVLDTGAGAALYGVLERRDADGPWLLAYGFGGRLLASRDGGTQWRTLPTDVPRPTFVAALDDGAGSALLLGQDASLWRLDGGRPPRPAGQVKLARAAAFAGLPEGRFAVAGIGGVAMLAAQARP
ncbi:MULTISPECIES: YCF48-related protein [unclassified Variovorax]|uniref:WD40/YVTN/BNR-like repeat-containing protein n=1 Tax=unclassified Variovorax TaxID=663243 RepID=UPI0025774BB6|nr:MULTISPECIES: YCF48-related protein [unclassified Variovorax]MDM0091413.1 YCF48-related protein [Variovorax sp. J22G40]MDM0149611.1 YCF48-related protein [Variovorax sp. J2P1-31]